MTYKKQTKGLLLWLLFAILAVGLILLPGCGKKTDGTADTSAAVRLAESKEIEPADSSAVSDASAEETAGSGSTDRSDVSGALLEETAGSGSTDSSAASDASAEETAGSGSTDRSGVSGASWEEETAGSGSADSSDVSDAGAETRSSMPAESEDLDEGGFYTSKEDVALYLHLYGHLPGNYITKKQAEKLGWNNKAGNLQEVAPGKSIGGSRFGNYEGLLPDEAGRNYYECDINYDGGYRGAERIIYSDDGLIFYTADHYKSFEQLY